MKIYEKGLRLADWILLTWVCFGDISLQYSLMIYL